MKLEQIVIITIILITAGSTNTSGQITFSEIMYNVHTNEHHDEFIEIFNLSYVDTIDCSGWKFSDSAGIDVLQSYQGGMKIAPRRYALILDGSYFGNSTTYDHIFTDSLIILKIDDNSFGKNGLSNSNPEWLTLRDSTGKILTEYTYSIGNKPGYSDEKINLDESDIFSNWSESKVAGGTPGRKNSVAPALYDFGFNENSFIFPFLLTANESIEFSLELINFGIKTIVDSLKIVIYSDMNGDKIFQREDLLIDSGKVATIGQQYIFEWNYPPAGQHHIVAQLYYELDEVQENNLISKDIRVYERDISLHVNEINFLTKNNEPEWIELVNYSKEPILLYNWSLADLSDTVCIDTHAYLQSGEYIVIGKESVTQFYQIQTEKLIILDKFLSLNDQEDELILINPSGSLLERIQYDRQWLKNEDYKCPSLERINPLLYENSSENWGPCIAYSGSTPGEKNSIFSELVFNQYELTASPNPFSPDKDGYEEVTIISGEIPESNVQIKVEIYDIRGRLIRRLKDNNYNGSHLNLLWDGKDNDGKIARIGIYIIYLQVLNDRKGLLREMKTTVVLAKKL